MNQTQLESSLLEAKNSLKWAIDSGFAFAFRAMQPGYTDGQRSEFRKEAAWYAEQERSAKTDIESLSTQLLCVA